MIALSRRARRIVIANLAIAATFITGLVLWDLLGHLPLPLGVAGHEGSTVIVGLNGMRLLAQRAWIFDPGAKPNVNGMMPSFSRMRGLVSPREATVVRPSLLDDQWKSRLSPKRNRCNQGTDVAVVGGGLNGLTAAVIGAPVGPTNCGIHTRL